MNEILKKLEEANKSYRDGSPIMSDSEYDNLLSTLPEEHPYRNKVESESLSENTFNHPIPMLSTQKAKTNEEILKWVKRIELEALQIGTSVCNIHIRVTAKLDGMAAKLYDNGNLVTRGNGDKGNIVTSCFDKGVVNLFNTTGIGEIVMEKNYFNQHLSNNFSHPRNVVVGIVMGDEVNEDAKKALFSETVHFVTYDKIYSVECDLEEFKHTYRDIEEKVRNNTPYPIDGVVIEVINDSIKMEMGSTDHHKNWQIALKPKDEEAVTKIEYISWQTGRTGKVTPVGNVEATELDGSIVKRVTFHNAKMVKDKRLSIGTKIGIIRSGGVIPKLESVIEESNSPVETPCACSSCGTILIWDKNSVELICSNLLCGAQINSRILHFFKTIGNCDGFGPATIDRIVYYDRLTIPDIYDLSEYEFCNMEFGEKTSANLTDELDRSMRVELEDWRFLAAFGVKNLGKGNCKKILQHYELEELFELTEPFITNIEGFGWITAENIIDGLAKIDEDFHLLVDEFNLKRTVLKKNQKVICSPISGKGIVFSGKMQANREAMQNKAKELGAVIQSGVSSKTDILVIGAKVGKSKIDKATKFDTRIMTEMDYYEFIN